MTKSRRTGNSPLVRLPGRMWQKMDPKKADSWLAAILGVVLRSAALVLLVFSILIIWKMLQNKGYMLQGFSVPKAMDENGLTSRVAALSMQDAIQNLKDEAASVKKDDLELGDSESSNAMNVHVMGVEISLNSIAFQLRQLLGRPQKRITGEFVRSGNNLSLMLRMSGADNASFEAPISDEGLEHAAKQLIARAAEKILERTDPYRLAVVYYRRQNFPASLQLVRMIIKDRPSERAWAYHAWGNILREEGRYEEAIPKFEQATVLDPKFSMAYSQWGYSLLRLKQREAGIEKLEKSLEFNPNNLDPILTLGWQYHMIGDSVKSDSAFSRGVKIAAGLGMESSAWQSWISSKIEWNDFEGAKWVADKALQSASESADGYVTRAMIHIARQDTQKAIVCIRQAYDLDPENLMAATFLARSLYLEKKYQEVISIAENFNPYSRQEMMATLLNLSAMSHNFLGEYDEARIVVKQLISRDSNFAIPYTTLAESYAFEGNRKDFYENVERAYRLGLRVGVIDWEEAPYDRYKKDKRVLELRKKYESEHEKIVRN